MNENPENIYNYRLNQHERRLEIIEKDNMETAIILEKQNSTLHEINKQVERILKDAKETSATMHEKKGRAQVIKFLLRHWYWFVGTVLFAAYFVDIEKVSGIFKSIKF